MGSCHSEDEIIEKGQKLVCDLDIESLLITRSENGMTLIQKGMSETHFPARAKEVYDVTGAGDTVISVAAAALACGYEMTQVAALANIAAGIVVGKLGTAAITMPELLREVRKELETADRGVVYSGQLHTIIQNAREHGEKIIFTNGCFDILHAGHVSYLEQARKQGDRLVIALNSDASITRLKGKGRPINSLERRMSVVAALECVDWVVSFDEDTPEDLIRLLKPDVLVKGGDYSLNEVVGGDIVFEYGGQVKVLNHYEKCSTTSMIDQIHSTKNIFMHEA